MADRTSVASKPARPPDRRSTAGFFPSNRGPDAQAGKPTVAANHARDSTECADEFSDRHISDNSCPKNRPQMVHAGRTTPHTANNCGQRRTSGVLFGVPERPDLLAFFGGRFLRKRDSGGLNAKSRSFHPFGEAFDDARRAGGRPPARRPARRISAAFD